MKKILFISIISMIIFSCEEEENTPPTPPTHAIPQDSRLLGDWRVDSAYRDSVPIIPLSLGSFCIICDSMYFLSDYYRGYIWISNGYYLSGVALNFAKWATPYSDSLIFYSPYDSYPPSTHFAYEYQFIGNTLEILYHHSDSLGAHINRGYFNR